MNLDVTTGFANYGLYPREEIVIQNVFADTPILMEYENRVNGTIIMAPLVDDMDARVREELIDPIRPILRQVEFVGNEENNDCDNPEENEELDKFLDSFKIIPSSR